MKGKIAIARSEQTQRTQRRTPQRTGALEGRRVAHRASAEGSAERLPSALSCPPYRRLARPRVCSTVQLTDACFCAVCAEQVLSQLPRHEGCHRCQVRLCGCAHLQRPGRRWLHARSHLRRQPVRTVPTGQRSAARQRRGHQPVRRRPHDTGYALHTHELHDNTTRHDTTHEVRAETKPDTAIAPAPLTPTVSVLWACAVVCC